MTSFNHAFAPLDEEEIAQAQTRHRSADPCRPILPVPEDAPQLTTSVIERFAPAGHTFTDG